MALASAGARFYYHALDMSPYLEGVDPTLTRDLAEHKPLGDNPVQLSAGHGKCAIALTGIYDTGPGSEEEVAWQAFNDGLARPFAHLPAGDSVGAVAYCGLADLSSEQITAGEGFVKFPVAVVGTEEVDRCAVLCPLAEQTASGNGASHDNQAPSAGGGAGYLLCTALGAGATVQVWIEHSEDGATSWDALVTFSALDVPGSQRAIPAGTAVRRYTRARWQLTNGSATIFVAFGRR